MDKNKNISPLQSNTLIILDWDDTLFPTTWANKNNININNIPPNIKKNYKEYDVLLFKLLSRLLSYGKVVIITNASLTWIHISAKIFPKTYSLILKHIEIISARDMYQSKFPSDMYKWKKLAFCNEVGDFFNNKYNTHNIISIGDADYEYKALVDLYSTCNIKQNKQYLKAVKLVHAPSLDKLIDQLNVLHESAQNICTSLRHLDLNFLET
jgi:hypothetical protein